MRVLDATLIVEIHHFFKRFETAVMHIGCASRDLTQGRRFKCAKLLSILGHHVTAKIDFVVVPADAEVVKFLVGDVEPGVALRAACFLPEEAITTVSGRIAPAKESS